MFYVATVFVVRKVSLPLELTCTSNTLSPPMVLYSNAPPDTLVNKYQRGEGRGEKAGDERFVSQIVEFPVAMHI